MRECCSCVDRHESIGKGYIFSDKLGGSINALKEIFFISYAFGFANNASGTFSSVSLPRPAFFEFAFPSSDPLPKSKKP